MDTCRNIYPITFEPVRKLLVAAYRSGDFSSANAVIVRNTVKQTAMVWKLLQLTSFVRGHATGDTNIKHAGELRLPDGACAVGVEHAGLGIEGELAERFGIYIAPDAYEYYGRCGDALESRESVQLRMQNSDREMSNCER